MRSFLLPLFAILAFPVLARAQTTHVIASDGLVNGWQNYSWATVNLTSSAPAHSGASAISVTAKGSEAVYLHHDAFETAPYQSIRFWLNGGATGNQPLQLNALRVGKAQTTVTLAPPTVNQWTQYTVLLSDLGVANVSDFDGFWIQNSSSAAIGTFYLDDVELVYAPAPNAVQISVQPQNVIRTLDSRMYGVNLAIWDSILTTSQTASLLSAVNFGAFRIPGGSASDDYDWQLNKPVSTPTYTWANGAGNFAKVIEANGTQAYVTVNYGSGTPEQAAAWVAYYNGSASNTQTIGVDSKSRDWKTVGYWASLRGTAPLSTDDGYNHLRISHPTPFNIRYWEVGNECYGTWEYDLHGVAGSGLSGVKYDPYTYAQAFNDFQAKMRAVDSSVRVGAVAVSTEDDWGVKTHPATSASDNTQHTGWTPVMLATMKSLSIAPDFLIYHYYAQNEKNESDPVLLQKGFEIRRDAADLRKRLNDYLGAPAANGVELVMTELNSVSTNPGKQTSNLVNGLFFAEAYATAAHTEYNSVLWWDLHNGAETNHNNASYLYGWRTFGCYDIVTGINYPGMPNNAGLPTFYAAKLLRSWARGGDQVVSATSSYPWLSVHAAKLADGRVVLLVINKHPDTDLSAQISLSGFAPGSGTATVRMYGKTNDAQGSANPDLTTSSVSGVSSTFNYTFPSYSMTVIELAAAAATPTIGAQPSNQAVLQGQSASFSVSASGPAPLTYQWFKDGAALGGQTSSTLTLANVQPSDLGSYTVAVTNSFGTTTSSAATLSFGAPGRLINLSIRSQAGSGSQTLIVGFIIANPGTKPVMIRGTGPTLTNFGVSGVLPDPKLDLYQGSTVIGTNDSWANAQNQPAILAATGDKLGQYKLDAKDTILLQPLAPGPYTAQITGVGGTTGVALVEVFDTDTTDPTAPGFAAQPRLVNVSARTQVGTGDSILIAGFIINGTSPKRLMIRATGPTLAQFGVTGVLADPKLQLFDGGSAMIAENDSWQSAGNVSEITAANGDKLGIYPLDPKEAVLIVNLAPGAYTAQVRGVNNTTGVALVELNELP